MTSLQLGYISLTAVMLILTTFIAWTAIKNSNAARSTRKRKITAVIVGLLGWHVYMYCVGKSGFIQNLDFPPRFAMMFIMPLFIFTGVFMYRNRKSAWIHAVPESWLVYIQSFRMIVETLFVASVTQGILHENVTIEGYNYDMIFAFTALLVGLLVFTLKVAPRRLALLWNYLGFAVLASVIFLFITTIYAPHLYGSETMLMPIEATFYPYVLVAGFLMPLAVFMHVWSTMQLSKRG